LNWPQASYDAQLAEELAVFGVKVAFAALVPTPTPDQLATFQKAITAENEADLAFINAVNAALSGQQGNIASLILDLGAAVTTFEAILTTVGVDASKNPNFKDAQSKLADIKASAAKAK
jgi:hypothetical protein